MNNQMNTDRYFRIFKIEKISDITSEELTRRFRILAKKYHPDHGGSTIKFSLIHDAYSYLKKLMKEHLKKETKKFFNPNYLYYRNGNVYDIKKRRWVKVKGKIINTRS
jgi:hypothetical protein